jgi:hypothetical protein
MTLSKQETGNILRASQDEGYIPSVRNTKEKPSKIKKIAVTAVVGGIAAASLFHLDQKASEVTTNRADVTFDVTAGNDTAAQAILAAEGNPHGDYTITETELSRAEAQNGQVTDGVAKGEVVTGIDLPSEPTGTRNENRDGVRIHFDGQQ